MTLYWLFSELTITSSRLESLTRQRTLEGITGITQAGPRVIKTTLLSVYSDFIWCISYIIWPWTWCKILYASYMEQMVDFWSKPIRKYRTTTSCNIWCQSEVNCLEWCMTCDIVYQKQMPNCSKCLCHTPCFLFIHSQWITWIQVKLFMTQITEEDMVPITYLWFRN